MYKFPGTPSTQANIDELADFVETNCLQTGFFSSTELSAAIGREEEIDYTRDGVAEDDEHDWFASEVFSELERRSQSCRDKYPFEIARRGYTLRLRLTGNPFDYIYFYLLLTTRLRMNHQNRMQAGIDATLLFEHLSAAVAREYWGNRAESIVFGTAVSGSFNSKVDDLCGRIREGGCFENRNPVRPTAQDDKLDVAVWKHFADLDYGKLIGFGQCKTGTEWRDSIGSLRPEEFCSKWMKQMPVVPPVRMLFVAESLPRTEWYTTCCNGGIIFDRCRIIDYCDSVPTVTVQQIETWTKAAANEHGLGQII